MRLEHLGQSYELESNHESFKHLVAHHNLTSPKSSRRGSNYSQKTHNSLSSESRNTATVENASSSGNKVNQLITQYMQQDLFRFSVEAASPTEKVHFKMMALFDKDDAIVAAKPIDLAWLLKNAGTSQWLQIKTEDGELLMAVKLKIRFLRANVE